MENRFKKFLRRIIRYFIEGLILVAPITITVYVLYIVFVYIDSILPFGIPGLGLIAIIVLITLTGLIGTTVIAKPILAYYNRLLERIPIIKILYTSVKDLMSAFVGQKKKFTEPVLVRMSSDSNIEKLGFVTRRDLSVLGIDSGKVAVFFPHSYNFSGNLFIVPVQLIKPIKASPTDIMKFIISGGITELENNTPDAHINKI